MEHRLDRRRFVQAAATLATLAAGVGAGAAASATLLRRDQIRNLTPGLGLDHPEGVTTGPDGKLYAGGVAGQVYRISPDGSFTEIVRTGGVTLGLAVDGDGFIYICDPIKRAVLRVSPEGAVSIYCDSAAGAGLVLPNNCAFGPDGSLWVTDSGHEDPDRASGRLLRIPVGGGTAEVQPLDPLHFPNGLCVDSSGTAFFVETFGRRLSSYSKGRLTRLGTTPGYNPDGVTLDRDGGFLITSYYPFALLTMKRGSRTPKVLFDDQWGITIRMPANSVFFGEGLRQLAISNIGGFALSVTTPPVPGAPLNYPKGIARSAAVSTGK